MNESIDDVDGWQTEGGRREIFGVVEQRHPRLEQCLVALAKQLIFLRVRIYT